jgi:hypothetical protein
MIANIVRDHAMILADDATPKPDGIFGKDSGLKSDISRGTNRGQSEAYGRLNGESCASMGRG